MSKGDGSISLISNQEIWKDNKYDSNFFENFEKLKTSTISKIEPKKVTKKKVSKLEDFDDDDIDEHVTSVKNSQVKQISESSDIRNNNLNQFMLKNNNPQNQFIKSNNKNEINNNNKIVNNNNNINNNLNNNININNTNIKNINVNSNNNNMINNINGKFNQNYQSINNQNHQNLNNQNYNIKNQNYLNLNTQNQNYQNINNQNQNSQNLNNQNPNYQNINNQNNQNLINQNPNYQNLNNQNQNYQNKKNLNYKRINSINNQDQNINIQSNYQYIQNLNIQNQQNNIQQIQNPQNLIIKNPNFNYAIQSQIYRQNPQLINSNIPQNIYNNNRIMPNFNPMNIIKNQNQLNDKKIKIEDIIIGKEKRTTLMLRNIPNKYTLNNVVDEIDRSFWGKYDYINLPIDYERKLNLGYAFINFVDPMHIILFYENYHLKKWSKYKSDKKMDMTYADKQGKKDINCKDDQTYFAIEDKRFVFNSLQPKIEIPVSYLNFFRKIYPNSVCVIEDKNGFYNDKYFVVKHLGKK